MSIEAMKLALEALEVSTDWDVNATGKQAKSMKAITALRTAIEQAQEQEQDTKTPLKVLDLTVRVECLLRRGRVYDVETLKAMDVRHLLAIPDFGKKALKEVSEALLKYELVTERRLMRKQRDQQAEKQEPVAWMHDSHVGFNVPLYTAPQREWVGLTDGDVNYCVDAIYKGFDMKPRNEIEIEYFERVIKFVEAKLKEKNAA